MIGYDKDVGVEFHFQIKNMDVHTGGEMTKWKSFPLFLFFIF